MNYDKMSRYAGWLVQAIGEKNPTGVSVYLNFLTQQLGQEEDTKK